MNKAEDIEQLIYRELPPDRYCYIHNFIVEKDKEIERLNNINQDLLYVLSQLDGYLDKGWTIDLNYYDIPELLRILQGSDKE